MRLLGFDRVQLEPGASRQVVLTADPRLLARFDVEAGRWHLAAGAYTVSVARSAAHHVLTADVVLHERRFGT